jgi:hypothetical protein
MSSAFIDLALAVGAPIIPVRFVGGLPVEEVGARLEFPVGFGRQDYWIGTPILPERLAAMPYKDRKATVLAAMNALGPELAGERPIAPDPPFEQLVHAWIARTGAAFEDASDVLHAGDAGRPWRAGPAVVRGGAERSLGGGRRSARRVAGRPGATVLRPTRSGHRAQRRF